MVVTHHAMESSESSGSVRSCYGRFKTAKHINALVFEIGSNLQIELTGVG
jgi:hypothetical protein